MKKMKIILGVGLLGLLLSGCNSFHQHTYSESWSYDESHHWHAATCEHTSEVKDKETHTFGEWAVDSEATEYETGTKHKICAKCEYRVDETIEKLEHTHKAGTPVEENIHEATCTIDGYYDLVTYCTECLEEISRERIVIRANGHNWGETIYEWSDSHSSCTAKRVCLDDPLHYESETVYSEYEVVTYPTSSNSGLVRFTASFKNDDFEEQIVELPVEAADDRLSFTLYSSAQSYSVKASSSSIEGNIIIPSIYCGLPVVSVESNGFKDCACL